MMFLKKYWLVIIATVAVSAFTALPSFFFFQRVGDNFRGVYPVFNGDAFYYQARVQEIADGHPGLNRPYFFENKHRVFPQATGAEFFLYGISKLSGLSAPEMQVPLDIVTPAVIFLLTYLLLKQFSTNEYTAVLFPTLLYTVVMGGIFKPVSPQITLPLLLLFLIFWAKLINDRENKWRNAVFAGILCGTLFLTYLYNWSFAVVLLGLYALVLCVTKSFAELKYHGLMTGIAVIIGIPYFVRLWQGFGAEFSGETAARLGLYFSHLPESYPKLAVALVWLVFFIFISRHYRILGEKRTQIVGVLLAANALYPNHQIITGVIIENAVHWVFMPILIFSVAGHYVLSVVRKQSPTVKNIFIFLLAALFVAAPAWRLSTFTWQPYTRLYRSGVTENRQYYAEVFAWINTHTEKDAVIFSDDQLMRFIPAYTHANVYNTQYAYNMPASDVGVIERYLLSHFFEPDFFDSDDLGINEDGRILWAFPHESEKNTHTIAGGWTIPYEPQYGIEKERKKVREVYNNLVTLGWNTSLLNKYRLDYIVWDRREKPEWRIEEYGELELVEQIGDVFIYRLNV